MVLGMIESFDHFVTGVSALTGSLSGLLSIVIFAIVRESALQKSLTWKTVCLGLYNTFYVVYDLPPFALGLFVSTIATLLAAYIEYKLNLRYCSICSQPLPRSGNESDSDHECNIPETKVEVSVKG